MQHLRVAAGILMRDEELLLVRQVSNGRDYWSLPGGVVEAQEGLVSGLHRELLEETGIHVVGDVRLAHVTELLMPSFTSVAFVFEIPEHAGDVLPDDPTNEVVESRFVVPAEARRLLALLPWPSMREPILAHLDGAGRPFWSYSASGSDDPVDAVRSAR